MQLTGRSAMRALGIALVGVVVLTAIYSLMAAFLDATSAGKFDLGLLLKRATGLFQAIGMCAGPILFILSFALLQRFRIR